MGSKRSSASLLWGLNVFNTILGIGITLAGIWIFLKINMILRLRDPNNTLLVTEIYWPQIMPWLFVFCGILVVSVSICGFIGAKKRRCCVVGTFITFELITTSVLLGTAVTSLLFGISKSSEEFISNAIMDSFVYAKQDLKVEEGFNALEKQLTCCGAYSPADYIKNDMDYPISCVSIYNETDKEAFNLNRRYYIEQAKARHGCSEVVIANFKFVSWFVIGGCFVTVVFSLINAIAALIFCRNMKNKNETITRHEKKGLVQAKVSKIEESLS